MHFDLNTTCFVIKAILLSLPLNTSCHMFIFISYTECNLYFWTVVLMFYCKQFLLAPTFLYDTNCSVDSKCQNFEVIEKYERILFLRNANNF